MSVNERQIALRTNVPALAKYAGLKDFLDRKKVVPIPFNDSSSVAVSSAQHALLQDVDFPAATTDLPRTIAKGKTTTTNGGVFCAALAGAFNAAATDSVSDDLGNVLNMVELRDAVTHDPVMDAGTDREVYGLIQCDNTAADGAAIGAVASENVQISFVYVDSAGAFQLATVNQTVEFVHNRPYLDRYLPTIVLEGGSRVQDVLNAAEKTRRGFQVTTAYPALASILVTTGAGAPSGASTPDGKTLNALPAGFDTDDLWQVRLNGVVQRKGSGPPAGAIEVSYVDGTHIQFRDQLDVGDYFEIEQLHN